MNKIMLVAILALGGCERPQTTWIEDGFVTVHVDGKAKGLADMELGLRSDGVLMWRHKP